MLTVSLASFSTHHVSHTLVITISSSNDVQVQQFYKPQQVISNSSISRRVCSGLYNCMKSVRIQQKDSAHIYAQP